MSLKCIYDIWTNLGSYYQKGIYSSWEEMMHNLCLVQDGTPRIQQLLSIMSASMEKTTDNINILEELDNIFQFVTDNYNSLLTQEAWSNDLLEDAKDYFDVIRNTLAVSGTFLEAINPNSCQSYVFSSLEDWLSSRYVYDTVVASDKDTILYKLSDNFDYVEWPQYPTNEDYISRIRSGIESGSVACRYLAQNMKNKDFLSAINQVGRKIVFDNSLGIAKEGENIFGSNKIVFEKVDTFLYGEWRDRDNGLAILIGVC